MNKLIKKHKITIIAVIIFIISGYGYITYTKEETIITDQDLGIVENIKEENEEKNKIKIHLFGAVKQEGILEIEEGSRIADAIEKAGGVKENACTNEINLAYLLEDGMKVKIPTNEEVQENKEQEKETEYIKNESGLENISDTKKTNSNQKNTKININTANQSEIEQLQGIGAETAKKIIKYRNENGKFKNITDIKNVKGIGESKFNKIKDNITI